MMYILLEIHQTRMRRCLRRSDLQSLKAVCSDQHTLLQKLQTARLALSCVPSLIPNPPPVSALAAASTLLLALTLALPAEAIAPLAANDEPLPLFLLVPSFEMAKQIVLLLQLGECREWGIEQTECREKLEVARDGGGERLHRGMRARCSKQQGEESIEDIVGKGQNSVCVGSFACFSGSGSDKIVLVRLIISLERRRDGLTEPGIADLQQRHDLVYIISQLRLECTSQCRLDTLSCTT